MNVVSWACFATAAIFILLLIIRTLFPLKLQILGKIPLWFLAALSINIGFSPFSIDNEIKRIVMTGSLVSILIQVGIWLTRAATLMIEKRTEEKGKLGPLTMTAAHIVSVIAKGFIWSFLLLLALDNIGFDLIAIVTGLGIGGIAIALAAQNFLADVFASFCIIIDKPFVVGDLIVIDEFSGYIEHVGIKTTLVRSITGELLIFSNADLLKSRIRNFRRMRERRGTIHFSLIHQTPTETLRRIPKILREIVDKTPNTRFDRAHFKTISPGSLDFELTFYALCPDIKGFMDAQEKINLAIHSRFKEEEITFAYPTQTIVIQNAKETVSQE